MTFDAPDRVALHAVRLGDRRRTARGWLIVAQGAVRGILSAGPDGEILHAFACDRRIQPRNGLIVFQDLDEALGWLDRRLPDHPRAPSGRSTRRALDEDFEPRHLTRTEAERALIAAANDYCWSVRNRALPEEGPLRRLWIASIECRLAVRNHSGATR